jgi:hypothetical protein
MIAIPTIPGRAYRVRGNGIDLTVLTNNPITAIVLAVQLTQ